jgi:hypothetical protein
MFETMALLSLVAFVIVSYVIYTPSLYQQVPHNRSKAYRNSIVGELTSDYTPPLLIPEDNSDDDYSLGYEHDVNAINARLLRYSGNVQPLSTRVMSC